MTSVVTHVTDVALVGINSVGLAFNLVVLYISLFRMKLRGLDVKLTMMTSVIDIVLAFGFLVLIFVKWSLGPEIVYDGSVWCKASGTLLVNAAVCSINVIGILALVRYLSIIKGYRLAEWIWIGVTLSMVLISTGLSFSGVGEGNFLVMPSGSYCEPRRSKSNSNSTSSIFQRIFTLSSLIRLIVGIFLITFCYISITLFYRRKLKVAANESSQFLNPSKNDSVLSQQPLNDYMSRRRNITVYMMLLLTAYAINLLPMLFSIFFTVMVRAPPPDYFDGIAAALVAALNITNPIFVLLIHEATHYEFMTLLRLKRRRMSTHPYADQFID